MNQEQPESATSVSPDLDTEVPSPESNASKNRLPASEEVWEDVPDDVDPAEMSTEAEPSPQAEPPAEAEPTAQAEPLVEAEPEAEAAIEGDSELTGELAEIQQPFVGQWNNLISTTNWEKGRIISEWRAALQEADAPVTEYSDEAWAARVGGVTAPHVGRLRRVFDGFGKQYESYQGLYWSHFLAALDWDDSTLWLQGAVEESWSISQMREQRWKANGEVASERPTSSQIVEVEVDEDTPELGTAQDLGTAPAQGDGSTKDYDGDTDGIESGPTYEGPDFGEENELTPMSEERNADGTAVADPQSPPSPIQPFAGLPELPDDMSDAIESVKLSILRHKTAGFEEVKPEVIRRYLEAVAMLLES